ncbi:hypothetical protein BIU82_06280 [Arthrobacter sp. SW1]|uniref:DUF6458 family protein n=1 Tax=Arthrobacter sp. SW1 TaxID=1920889 RepID=UPI000877D85E|nr:DUF6458 family protein [Arthrobacter sp. SW1]OFI38101.1 hypothetical protein BIU82_06280 [Arthrobacter sp. SW1]
MYIGTSIFLIAVGAILAFALTPGIIPFLDQQMAGYILIVVGAIGLIASLIWAGPRRRHKTSESHRSVDPDTGEAVTRRETRDTGI